MNNRAPEIRELTPADARALLARHHVGRIAFSFRDRVDVQPIHYVYHDAWIYGRTSPGTKLTTIQHNRWVAFEVDEVESLYTWRSVVVHGAFYALDPAGAPAEREHWEHAVNLLRRLAPHALSDADPVPFRTVVFRIAVQEISGRASVDPLREESSPRSGG